MPNKDEIEKAKLICEKDFSDMWKRIVGPKASKLCKCGIYLISDDEEMCEKCKILYKK